MPSKGEAKQQAYARYYTKHREELLPKQREKDKARREKLKEACENDPVLLEKHRAKMREKYYRMKARKNEKRIKALIETDMLSDGVKRSLQTFIDEDICGDLTATLVRHIETRVAALKVDDNSSDNRSDGGHTESEEGESESD